jgi:eukaryotic-like serine/threonine-protein kinase
MAEELNLDSILCAAVELESPGEREAFLEEACGENASLKRQVQRLLRAHFHGGSLLDSPAVGLCETTGPLVTEKPGDRIGPYKLLQQIGEGGMGVVYMAEQTEPVKRRVAVKIIKPGMDTEHIIARFEVERQALAMMDHPHIAKVLDAGKLETGRPYFVMELVKGVPVTQYCDEHHLTTSQRLKLFVPICRAVQHAHQKGVIHRDLKPSNILVAEYDHQVVPKIIDFGVAKALSQSLTDRTMFTRFGEIIGTLDYMSPEQAKFNQLDIDTRSDIYALGVLLYELLTGTTPFDKRRLRSSALDEVLRIIREEEPPKPSTRLFSSATLQVLAANRSTEAKRLPGLIRGDLDWIVMKALDKERSRRYDTASRLADDVDRYLHDEAIEARPPSTAYKVRKFVRRNKGPVAAAVTVAAVLIAGIVGTTIGLVRAESAANLASSEASRANRLAGEAQQSEQRATREAERYRRVSYLSDMNAALPIWQAGDAGRAADLLRRHLPQGDADDLRGFEWYYLFALCQRSLMTPTIEGNSAAVAYSPNGKLRAHSDGKTVRLVDVDTDRSRDLFANEAPVMDLAFSPDGKLLASADSGGIIQLWDVNAQTLLPPLVHGSSEVPSLAFSHDSQTLASTSWLARSAKLWNLAAGTEPTSLQHNDPVTSVAFSYDETTVATCDWEGTLVLWDAETYKKLNSTPGHAGPAMCVLFARSGDQLISAGVDGTVKIWSIAKGQFELLRSLSGHTGSVKDLAISGHDDLLASGGIDNTVRLWNLQTGEQIDVFRGTAPIAALAFDPSSGVHTLAAAGHDGIKLWNTSQRPPRDMLTEPTGEVCYGVFLADRDAFVTCGWDGIVRFWDTRTWEVKDTLQHDDEVYTVAVSPDGHTLATAGADGTIRLYRLNVGEPPEELDELVGHPDVIWSVAFSPDSRLLVSAGAGGQEERNGTVRIWDLSTDSETKEIDEYRYGGHPGVGRMAVFSPDGKTVASGSADGMVRLWDIASRQQRILTRDAAGLWNVVFSPDGKTLAVTAGRDVKLWDLATGVERTLQRQGALVMHVDFLPPDGKTLVTAGHEGSVRLWDAETCQLRFEFPSMGTGVNYMFVSPDGKTIALCCRDATIRLLHAATEEDVRAAGWYED